jgi:hypothetical protein
MQKAKINIIVTETGKKGKSLNAAIPAIKATVRRIIGSVSIDNENRGVKVKFTYGARRIN